METLLSKATVVDGSGSPRRQADVLIAQGRIQRIAEPGALTVGGVSSESSFSKAVHDVGNRRIDAEGLVLAPGFIDMHAHSDLHLLTEPDHYAKLSQGVTTEVLGQDGLSYAPVDEPTLDVIRQKIAGWNGNPTDLDFDWRSVGEYLGRLDRSQIAGNAAYLVPQGTVRALVMGFAEGAPDAAQLARMQEVIAEAMQQGAVGMSSGLTYTPGMYADSAELTALCETVAELGGFYAPHHRSYGKGALAAYAEMIELSKASGCPLHLSHATMNFAENKGRAGELLALIDEALECGADITLDSYPYLPGATTLSALLPSWASSGSLEQTLQRLEEPETLARIRQSVEIYGSDGCHGVTAEWHTIEISGVQNPELSECVGKTIEQLSGEQRREPFEVFIELLRRDRLGTGILQHVGDEPNVRQIMQHRAHTGGSDGILTGAKPHPRSWGTFPRYLGHYSRELGLLSLEEMVHHLSGRPAARLQLHQRGLIKEGYAADLVLFDAEQIADRASFAQPRQPAVGIHWVFVNGQPAIAAGKPTGARAGRALRRHATDQGVIDVR
ncbi:amidohydrolase family protein [Psychromicrobium sp. YIM B11713]|uniref:N-acyl-D-amino-acid deacylase family protein n=1 Tax=Psychromicrobium sp. YIM B11713 TaxID=3145233 RepID=UPI00374EA01D